MTDQHLGQIVLKHKNTDPNSSLRVSDTAYRLKLDTLCQTHNNKDQNVSLRGNCKTKTNIGHSVEATEGHRPTFATQ